MKTSFDTPGAMVAEVESVECCVEADGLWMGTSKTKV